MGRYFSIDEKNPDHVSGKTDADKVAFLTIS
jgi:hypothetical protein